MTLKPAAKIKLTHHDYYSFLTKPRPIWSLFPSELSKLINQKQNDTSAAEDDELTLAHQREASFWLRELGTRPDPKYVDELNAFLLDSFKANVSAAEFKNTTIHRCGQHQRTVAEYQKILAENSTVFLFQPKFEDSDFMLEPFCIFKHKGNIFLIDHFSSNSLTRARAAKYLFYNHVLSRFFKIHIDQFAHIYQDPEGNNAITECLPRTTKNKKFTDINDDKFSDVNLLLKKQRCLGSLYLLGLPKREESDENWDSLNFDIHSISDAISQMIKKTAADPHSETQLIECAKYFLANQKSLFGLNNAVYKDFFRLHINNLDFNPKYYKFDFVVKKIVEYADIKKVNKFLQWINNMGPFERPHVLDESEEAFFIFEKALVQYAEYKNIKNVVYCKLDSIYCPEPSLHQHAPFEDEIFQVSVIKCKNGTETEKINEIFDHKSSAEVWLEKLINSIYLKGDDVCYVVDDKTFVHDALDEIANSFPQLSEKISDIIGKTINFDDWFTYSNDPCIILRCLGGYSSVQAVTEIIPRDIIAKAKFDDCVDLELRTYTPDALRGGFLCKLTCLIYRFLRKLTPLIYRFLHHHMLWSKNYRWQVMKEILKRRCANDVRRMIATDLFIRKILQAPHTVYPLEEFLNKKKNLKNI